MDRVFLDANILLIASYRKDAALARLWELPDVRLLVSSYALHETWRNAVSTEQRMRLAELVPAMMLVSEQPEDEATARAAGLPDKDVPILHAAVSGRATHLLTADRQHFGPLRGTTVAGVLIQSPSDYLRLKQPRESDH
jgi:uncharacterized protein